MAELNMKHLAGFVFHFFGRRTVPGLKGELIRLGFRIYELDGSTVRDKRSLFEAFSRDILGGALSQSVNLVWDAFTDALWQVLQAQPEDKIAIIWLAADKMLKSELPLLANAIECLNAEAYKLSEAGHGNIHPILLRIFLIGEGTNFPDSLTG